MRFRKTLTVLILALAFALAAWAQQKHVAPTLRSALAPARRGAVSAGPWPAGADLKVSATSAAGTGAGLAASPAKPFTQEQVSNMVRDGLGDETGAKAITQRGIDFAPTEDFIQSLKTAGASEAVVAALRAAKPPEPASAKKPINQVQVFALLASQVPSHRVAVLVKERGISFVPKGDYLDEVRLGGGDDELINALKNARMTLTREEAEQLLGTKRIAAPETVDPALQARQQEIQQHAARGAELAKKAQYLEAEQEYRAALLLDSQNADLYVSLAGTLLNQKKWDDATSAAREALRLNPNDEWAHGDLGFALGRKGDLDGEVAEESEAIRLDPDNDQAHINLGVALGSKGDHDGAIAQFREAVRLNPKSANAHSALGYALGNRRDWDGEISEEREALRLDPRSDLAHGIIGSALGNKGDWDGEVAEEREALRLNPGNEDAHLYLAIALVNKGDWDGAIAEENEALRLNPKNAEAHYSLCTLLDKKGDIHAAREECHAAYLLRPSDASYRSANEQMQRAEENTTEKTTLEGLPPIELAKVEGTCRWETNGEIMCDVYNGSGWNILEVIVQITVKEHDKEKGDTVVL